jgi:stage V sporulation protein G
MFFQQEEKMKISDIRVTLRNEEKLKGFVNITFDDCFIVRGCKIIQGEDGYFVSMPSWKGPDGSYRDIAHPTNGDMRRELEDKILKAYEIELNSRRSSIART